MPILGESTRIVYAAKNYASGVTGISAHVVKPDGNLIGPLVFNPFASPTMAGLYYADLLSNPNDPYGIWAGMILSPSEAIKAPFKVEFTRPIVSGGTMTLPGGTFTGELKQVNTLTATIETEAVVNADIATAQVAGTIENEIILTGVIEDEGELA